jgi:phosphoribosylanthranilate isomerase
MTFVVKICGVRRRQDVEAARAAGADLLGFNFVGRSKRCLTRPVARSLARGLPAGLAVGVFENAQLEDILRTCSGVGLTAAQVHGPLSPEDAQRLASHLQLYVARPGAHRDAAVLAELAPHTTAFLFDGPRPGSGQAWSDPRPLGPLAAGRPTLLAGGLSPATVAHAVTHFRPGGVDVASGVEGPDGQIDAARVAAFVTAARAAAGALS